MYRTIDGVMRRINTYEYEYLADEREAEKLGCKLTELNPCRRDR